MVLPACLAEQHHTRVSDGKHMVLWELSENYQFYWTHRCFWILATKACTPRFGTGGWVFTLFCRKEGTQRLTGGNKAADSFSGPLVFRAWPYLTHLCQQHIILNGFSPCPLALRLQKVGVGFCLQNAFGCRLLQAKRSACPTHGWVHALIGDDGFSGKSPSVRTAERCKIRFFLLSFSSLVSLWKVE